MIMLVHLTVVTYSDLSGLENKFGGKYYCRRATLVLGGMLSSGRIHEIVIVIPDHRRSSSSTKEERSIDRSQTCEYFENIFFLSHHLRSVSTVENSVSTISLLLFVHSLFNNFK